MAREILPDDLDSAKRGLRMSRLTDGQLRAMRDAHSKLQFFASRVIAQAASEVLSQRAEGKA